MRISSSRPAARARRGDSSQKAADPASDDLRNALRSIVMRPPTSTPRSWRREYHAAGGDLSKGPALPIDPRRSSAPPPTPKFVRNFVGPPPAWYFESHGVARGNPAESARGTRLAFAGRED